MASLNLNTMIPSLKNAQSVSDPNKQKNHLDLTPHDEPHVLIKVYPLTLVSLVQNLKIKKEKKTTWVSTAKQVGY